MYTQREYDVLNKSIDELKVAANNFGIRFINDEQARYKYNKLTKQMADEILHEVHSGKISPLQGAEKAQTARNVIMEQIRKITSDIGKARAEAIKKMGKSLSELENKYALHIFKKPFNLLSQTEKNQIWLEIVASSGRPHDATNLKVRKWGRAGRVFLVMTFAIAAYNISTADDKATAAAREGASLGGGFLGGAGGGAVAGLACGPGAPVCVTIGVFIGGVLGAIGADSLFDFFSSKPVAAEPM